MRLFAMLAILALCAGCAFNEEVVTIHYIPSAATPVAGAGPVALSVVDGRTADRTKISAKMNAYGMELAAIRSDKDVVDIVRDALITELAERGFRIEAGGPAVGVTVDRFYNQFGVGVVQGNAGGEVRLSVTVKDATGASRYAHSYAGASHIDVFRASGSNAEESVAAALRDAVLTMFADPALVGALAARSPAASSPVS